MPEQVNVNEDKALLGLESTEGKLVSGDNAIKRHILVLIHLS